MTQSSKSSPAVKAVLLTRFMRQLAVQEVSILTGPLRPVLLDSVLGIVSAAHLVSILTGPLRPVLSEVAGTQPM